MSITASRLLYPLVILSLTLSGFLSACSSEEAVHSFPMASMSEMPTIVQEEPVSVQQAYQFAVANPDVLEKLPCYCGCGEMGHTSNYSCYVIDEAPDNRIVFDYHATGCSICVDITQDAMRMLDEGKTLPEIRAYVDQTYAKFGPSNIP
jgi:hypothetical protein